MTGFHNTWSSSGSINLADIEFISEEKPNKWGAMVHSIRLRGRTREIETPFEQPSSILWRPVQMSPALLGTNMIRVYIGDGIPPEVYRSTVIAWAICLGSGPIKPLAVRAIG